MTTKLENMTDAEKAEFYWENPEAIPDKEHWEGFMAEAKEDE